jgi:hypothetical protein
MVACSGRATPKTTDGASSRRGNLILLLKNPETIVFQDGRDSSEKLASEESPVIISEFRVVQQSSLTTSQ